MNKIMQLFMVKLMKNNGKYNVLGQTKNLLKSPKVLKKRERSMGTIIFKLQNNAPL